MKKMNSLFAVSDDSSALPVCLENAWKSFTDPGSVARILSTWPEVMSVSAFLVRRMGSGQFRPRASSSLSNCMDILVSRLVNNETLIYDETIPVARGREFCFRQRITPLPRICRPAHE